MNRRSRCEVFQLPTSGNWGMYCSPFLTGVTEALGEQGWGSTVSYRLDEPVRVKDVADYRPKGQAAATVSASFMGD